jgi:hypothetical protein
MNETILVISGQVVSKNSKINWPDLNYPGTGQTILRTLHHVDYGELWFQLDNNTGPIFHLKDLPEGVKFFKPITKD